MVGLDPHRKRYVQDVSVLSESRLPVRAPWPAMNQGGRQARRDACVVPPDTSTPIAPLRFSHSPGPSTVSSLERQENEAITPAQLVVGKLLQSSSSLRLIVKWLTGDIKSYYPKLPIIYPRPAYQACPGNPSSSPHMSKCSGITPAEVRHDCWRAGGVSPLMERRIRGLTPPARRCVSSLPG